MQGLKIISLIVSFIFFLFLALPIEAAKILPRFKSSTKTNVARSSSGVYITPRLRSDRRALLVYFSNLNNASGIEYTLIYKTNRIEEGVKGSIDISGSNAENREFLFGTCSSGACTYHSNISDMRFEVTTQLKNGKKTLRRYRIRA